MASGISDSAEKGGEYPTVLVSPVAPATNYHKATHT